MKLTSLKRKLPTKNFSNSTNKFLNYTLAIQFFLITSKWQSKCKVSQGLVWETNVVTYYDTRVKMYEKENYLGFELNNAWLQVFFSPKRLFLSLKVNTQIVHTSVYIHKHLYALKCTWVYICKLESVYVWADMHVLYKCIMYMYTLLQINTVHIKTFNWIG